MVIAVRLLVSLVDWKTIAEAEKPAADAICHVEEAWVSESASENAPAVSVGVTEVSVATLAGELFVGVAGLVFVAPVSDTVRVKLPELTVSVAVWAEAAPTDWYVTVAVVLAPPAREAIVVGVTLNWLPLVVESVKLVSASVPVFWIVTAQPTVPSLLSVQVAPMPLAELSGRSTVPKSRLEGVTVRPYWIPTPVRFFVLVWSTVASMLPLLDGMVTVAALVPTVVGLNRTTIWHVPEPE
jgi:hypothetical protein